MLCTLLFVKKVRVHCVQFSDIFFWRPILYNSKVCFTHFKESVTSFRIMMLKLYQENNIDRTFFFTNMEENLVVTKSLLPNPNTLKLPQHDTGM